MLNETEKSQIRSLLQSSQWKTIEKLADLICEKIKDEPISTESEWETAKTVLEKEGQIKGIRRFIQEIFLQGAESNE
uniref:Uncharacterized protein n=1 Tax=candidate division CPR3 bacterium TaxID=2268181 RepID=A0A7V3N4Q5_UNCC3